MKNVMVFSGTTEGRMIGDFLEERKISGYLSVATEYGKKMAGEYRYVNVLYGRMDQAEMEAFFTEHEIGLVIDATHPFAQLVTDNIKKICSKCNISYLRCLRERIGSIEEDETVYQVGSVKEAVSFLQHTSGNILIATGSKELHEYQNLEDYQNRCYARILSTLESVQEAVKCGFEGTHLIAMQGPFSKSMNCATIEQVKAEWFVTKEAGNAGGFLEKKEAAKLSGAKLLVVRRPEENGMSVEELKIFIEKEIFKNAQKI